MLVVACGHSAALPVVCPVLPSRVLPDDPTELERVITGVKLRDPEGESPECSSGEVCVASCEEGTICAACERVLTDALHKLSTIETDEAARVGAALVLDDRLDWDGGHALTVAWSITRMKARVLPYLEPYVAKSSLAEMIVDCIRRNHPCH